MPQGIRSNAVKGKTRMNEENILEINHLERNYSTLMPDGQQKIYSVLRGISFCVKRGEFIGIMGCSGCGKTTLLKTIGMLNKPDGGNVLYKGEDTAEVYGDHLAEIRRTQLAFVFQDFYLLNSLTVRENIMMPLILNEDDPEKSSKVAETMAKKLGINDLLDKKPYELSGGEKQRTAICRAMAEDPELILADEPTGNLDSKSSKQVIDTLCYINREYGKTIVMVTHDPKMASHCGRLILLKDGMILDDLKNSGDQESFYQQILWKMNEL